jgi:hypothetical protein
MQISSSNLLLASQLDAPKLSQPSQPAQPQRGASFAAALAEPNTAAAKEDFSALVFKKVASEPSAPRAQSAPSPNAGAPMGSQLDIRV